jgi:hypothetical protein
MANTRFFHCKANARHGKNTLHALQTDEGIITDQDEMLKHAHAHFDRILGTHSAASSRFKWEALGLPFFDLSTLELPFSMDEQSMTWPRTRRPVRMVSPVLFSASPGTRSRMTCTRHATNLHSRQAWYQAY